MRRTAILLGLASLGLVANAVPLNAAPTLVGIWFSPFQPDEDGVMSLIEFRADGTFREEFRKCNGGDYVGYQTESGTWSVAGDVEHLISDRINGDPASSASDYKIILLTDSERRIRLEPQGYVFIAHRVQKFEFPDCASGI
ncbi:MAG: lipocalin family protein [Alphaproteobacteria bacterium]|nr:lipocalin family protein [Alphaproteobacteria bacterium]